MKRKDRDIPKMTAQQLKLFSPEWRALFAKLVGTGYHVGCKNGITHIWDAENRMEVCHKRGRWHMTLLSPHPDMQQTIKRRKCSEAISRVIEGLQIAKNDPETFSFRHQGRETA